VASQVIGTGAEGSTWSRSWSIRPAPPSVQIATDPHVQEIGVHRTAGLDGQWLIAATPEDG
jgi:hypothetical protein